MSDLNRMRQGSLLPTFNEEERTGLYQALDYLRDKQRGLNPSPPDFSPEEWAGVKRALELLKRHNGV